MDEICIKDLEVYCHHGVLKEENVLGQKFLVSATLYTDITKAAATDNIEYSINYAEVAHFIEKYMKEHTFRLIESVVERLARKLLVAFPLIQRISLEVKKPWAPILLPLDTVSVKVSRGWHKVYLSIGSNMGNTEDNLNQAIKRLSMDDFIRVEQVSSFITTKPYGDVPQDDFLNGAIECLTLYEPKELLAKLHEVEAEGKRERTIHWGPRTIDVDIVFYDDIVMNDADLIIPHRDMQNRMFVLEPLCEIAPWVRHPVFGKTVMELKGEINP
jgi:dihydroneopterin aldolase/2-amino-4-hydroxy-6-hydroxymethyldihydropteridine diphosphokinase